MAQPNRNGKLPLSSKQAPSPISAEDIFDNALGLDPLLTETIEKSGYAYRFINAKRFADMGGSHPSRWRPVSRKQLKEWGYDTMSVSDFTVGSDPDGYIRRAELVLSVRPKELNDKHKAYLKQEANRARVKNLSATHANEARSKFGGKNSGIQVHEGYEHDYVSEANTDEE